MTVSRRAFALACVAKCDAHPASSPLLRSTYAAGLWAGGQLLAVLVDAVTQRPGGGRGALEDGPPLPPGGAYAALTALTWAPLPPPCSRIPIVGDMVTLSIAASGDVVGEEDEEDREIDVSPGNVWAVERVDVFKGAQGLAFTLRHHTGVVTVIDQTDCPTPGAYPFTDIRTA